MAKNHPVDYVRLVAGLMPKQIQAEVNETEIKATMPLPDFLKELEVLSERLSYEIRPKPLPHFRSIKQIEEVDEPDVVELKAAKY